jgi:hypothetical protein
MRNVLADFARQLDKFDRRAQRLSLLALNDPEQDTDERAAMTLLVSGTLEAFLKDVTREYVSLICSRGAAFDKLPVRIRRSHYEEGARHLLRVAAEESRLPGKTIDFAAAKAVCRRLSSAHLVPYELVWEGFATTNSNANPETIKTILQRLDVKKPWETMEASIPATLHPLPPGSTRANKLNADLRDLRDARNRCAHGGADSAAPAWSLLLGYIGSLRAIAGGMVAALEARFTSMPQ